VKTAIIGAGVLLFLTVPLFLKVGVRPFCRPYEFARSMPSARDYWIEFDEGGPGWIRHKYGGRWSLRMRREPEEIPFEGEGSRLWRVSVPGIDREFLIVDTCCGAYTFHRLLYLVEAGESLVAAKDIATVAEVQGDSERHVLDATFEDVDGDGIPELKECHREWIYDDRGELINNWGIRTLYFAWDGRGFQPMVPRLPDGENSPPLPVERRP